MTLDYPGDIKSNKGGSWWMLQQAVHVPAAGRLQLLVQERQRLVRPRRDQRLRAVSSATATFCLRVVDENGHGVAGGRGDAGVLPAAGIQPCRV